jgi:hypothetical protein
MKKVFVIICAFAFAANVSAQNNVWSVDKANAWSKKWGWLRGANFQPSTAVNQLEMFQAETFDTITINKELGWAEDLGMNCMRVFLHHVAWETDKDGFKTRLNKYLEISWKHHIGTMFVFFDDCWNKTYQAGKQPEPKTGIHNSGWLRDPGELIFSDSTLILTLEAYVKDILTTFANDKRIIIWDLYNEPGNNGLGNKSLPLLKKIFEWGRTINPVQPLTSGIWAGWLKDLNKFQLENSDVISYHNYEYIDEHHKQIDSLKFKYGRPLICSEYMARSKGSLFQTIMPLLKKENVGAINWGFVSGKTNTIFAWDAPIKSGKEPALWFHDILRKNGTPFSEDEIITIKRLTGKIK